MVTPETDPAPGRGFIGARRLFLLLAALGLLYAVVFTAQGGTILRRQKQQQQLAGDHRPRATVVTSKSRIRPLDKTIQDAELQSPWNRRVLGLYNSLDAGTDAESNPVHLRAELILNHLGLLVEHRDVNLPLPDDNAMTRYRGVVVWFSGSTVKRPVAYLRWLKRQIDGGRKVVLLDWPGQLQDTRGRPATGAEINLMLEALGMRRLGAFTDESARIEVASKDSSMVEFERKLPPRLEHYVHYKLVDVSGSSYLKLRRSDRPRSTSDMVLTTATGGFVARNHVVSEHKLARNFVYQWHIDPFRFFARALDLSHSPRPDFTTLYGSRIFYSHIDGDGLPSISEIDRKSMCGDYSREHLLERYDLPVTASFVVAGIQPPPGGVGDRHRLRTARKIARLPNVEVGIHGFAHPMDWRARTQAHCSYDVPGYKMSAEKEIAYAARFVNQAINPPGKPVMVMLWTGWTNPAEDQIGVAYREGLYNLNGGDPIMDGQFPSYLHLAPPIHQVGKYPQYFTSASNEYILTEEWKAPYHRWANVIQTFRNTDAPRRIYPINVYYHFYIAQKKPAMVAMKRILDWVVRQRTAPLWVSQYVDVVRDFAHMRIGRLPGAESWRVLNSGYCRTVRFDRLDRHLDLSRSRGVLGYSRLPAQGALYVHLDESHDHTIVLSSSIPRRPYLRLSSAYLRDVSVTRQRATLTMRGIGRKHLSLANMSPHRAYAVWARNEEGKELKARRTADSQGTLSWDGGINGENIKVVLQREQRP